MGCKERSGGRESVSGCYCPWWADFKFEGKRRIVRLHTGDKKVAEERSHVVAVKGEWIPDGAAAPERERMRFSAYVEQFVAGLARTGRKERSITNCRRTLDALATFGVVYLDEVDAARLDRFYASRKGRLGYAAKPSSLVEDSKVLRRFFKFCIMQGAMTKDPTAGEVRPKDNRQCSPPFTDAEVAAILANAPDRPTRVLIDLMLTTGLRIGDACTLRRDAIDESGTLEKVQIKNSKNVVIPLGDYPKLIGDLAALEGNDVFCFLDGEEDYLALTQHWRNRIQNAFKAAGIKGAWPHQLRDTAAIRWLRAGVPIHEVSMLLGHQSVVITQKYYARYNSQMKSMLVAAMARASVASRETKKIPTRNEVRAGLGEVG